MVWHFILCYLLKNSQKWTPQKQKVQFELHRYCTFMSANNIDHEFIEEPAKSSHCQQEVSGHQYIISSHWVWFYSCGIPRIPAKFGSKILCGLAMSWYVTGQFMLILLHTLPAKSCLVGCPILVCSFLALVAFAICLFVNPWKTMEWQWFL